MGFQVVRRRRTAAVTGLVAALGLLTLAVVRGWWPVSLDHAVYAALPGRHAAGAHGFWLTATQGVVDLARPEDAVVVTLLVAAALTWQARSSAAVRIVLPPIALLIAAVVGGKIAVDRLGPGATEAHLLGCYPSGHTTTAVVCAGLVAHLLSRIWPARGRALAAAAALWGVLVAASMVVHGYHWLTDVIAGLLLGALLLLLTLRRGRMSAPDATVTRGR